MTSTSEVVDRKICFSHIHKMNKLKGRVSRRSADERCLPNDETMRPYTQSLKHVICKWETAQRKAFNVTETPGPWPSDLLANLSMLSKSAKPTSLRVHGSTLEDIQIEYQWLNAPKYFINVPAANWFKNLLTCSVLWELHCKSIRNIEWLRKIPQICVHNAWSNVLSLACLIRAMFTAFGWGADFAIRGRLEFADGTSKAVNSLVWTGHDCKWDLSCTDKMLSGRWDLSFGKGLPPECNAEIRVGPARCTRSGRGKPVSKLRWWLTSLTAMCWGSSWKGDEKRGAKAERWGAGNGNPELDPGSFDDTSYSSGINWNDDESHASSMDKLQMSQASFPESSFILRGTNLPKFHLPIVAMGPTRMMAVIGRATTASKTTPTASLTTMTTLSSWPMRIARSRWGWWWNIWCIWNEMISKSASALIRLFNSLTIKNRKRISSAEVSCLIGSHSEANDPCASGRLNAVSNSKHGKEVWKAMLVDMTESSWKWTDNAKQSNCHVTV